MFFDSIQECQGRTCHNIALYKGVREALPIIHVAARTLALCAPCAQHELAAGLLKSEDVEPLHITKGMMVRGLKGMLRAVRDQLVATGSQRDFTLMELVGNMGIPQERRDIIMLVRDALTDILKQGRLLRALPSQGDLRMQVIVSSQVTMPTMQGMPGMPGMLSDMDDEQSDFGSTDWIN